MKLNLSTVGTLFRTEMRMVLRDRRMLLTSIVLPLLVTPLMFLGSNWSLKRRERALQDLEYHYAVIGSQSAAVRELLKATRDQLAIGRSNEVTGAVSETHSSNSRKKTATRKVTNAPFKFEERSASDALEALNKGDLHMVIEGLTAEEARLQAEQKQAQTNAANAAGQIATGKKWEKIQDDGESPVPGAPVLRLIYRGDRDESASAISRLQEALSETRRTQRAGLLKAQGFPIRPAEAGRVVQKDLASKTQVAGLALGRSLTLLLLLFILSGGAVVAIDSIAGEKERGTLETLLTTGASRVEILAAKHLVILAVALTITLIQTANLLVYVGFRLMPVPPNLSAAVPPWVAVLLFLLYLPVTALAANVLLLISGYARSYKEAQMYFLPVLLVGLLPAVTPFLPGLPLRSAIAVVPIANLAVAVKEVLVGRFDWPMIALSWVVTAGAAVWTTRLGVRFLLTERLITAADTDAVEFAGGPALFERHVAGWFAVLWALLLIVSNYTEKADLRVQVAINLIGLFLGASALMLRRYRLNPRAALALRLPRPVVWLGVLFAVPGGLFTALGLFRLASFFLPISSKVEESFNQSLFPQNVPLIQLLFFLTVLPGICEEIAFRGMLLHGLHRRLHPAALALVVGMTFGIFHVALFRFVPTACLGMMFAAVTMLTGSIYPAMLWHCLNNAAGILFFKFQLPEGELQPICYFAGAGMLAAAFWVFWRTRTPYPGLRPWRRQQKE